MPGGPGGLVYPGMLVLVLVLVLVLDAGAGCWCWCWCCCWCWMLVAAWCTRDAGAAVLISRLLISRWRVAGGRCGAGGGASRRAPPTAHAPTTPPSLSSINWQR